MLSSGDRGDAGYSVQPISNEEIERQKTEFARLLEDLGPASHEQIRAALEARETGKREAGLTSDLVGWLEESTRSSSSMKRPG